MVQVFLQQTQVLRLATTVPAHRLYYAQVHGTGTLQLHDAHPKHWRALLWALLCRPRPASQGPLTPLHHTPTTQWSPRTAHTASLAGSRPALATTCAMHCRHRHCPGKTVCSLYSLDKHLGCGPPPDCLCCTCNMARPLHPRPPPPTTPSAPPLSQARAPTAAQSTHTRLCPSPPKNYCRWPVRCLVAVGSLCLCPTP